MSYAPQIKIIGEFVGNVLRFASEQEAQDAALFLASRWPWRASSDAPIPDTRAVSAGDDAVNYTFVSGILERAG